MLAMTDKAAPEPEICKGANGPTRNVAAGTESNHAADYQQTGNVASRIPTDLPWGMTTPRPFPHAEWNTHLAHAVDLALTDAAHPHWLERRRQARALLDDYEDALREWQRTQPT